MSKAVVNATVSLDGFIARPDNSVGWGGVPPVGDGGIVAGDRVTHLWYEL